MRPVLRTMETRQDLGGGGDPCARDSKGERSKKRIFVRPNFALFALRLLYWWFHDKSMKFKKHCTFGIAQPAMGRSTHIATQNGWIRKKALPNKRGPINRQAKAGNRQAQRGPENKVRNIERFGLKA